MDLNPAVHIQIFKSIMNNLFNMKILLNIQNKIQVNTLMISKKV